MRGEGDGAFRIKKIILTLLAPALIVIVCSACYARRDVGKHGIDNWEITVEDDVWRGYILAHNCD